MCRRCRHPAPDKSARTSVARTSPRFTRTASRGCSPATTAAKRLPAWARRSSRFIVSRDDIAAIVGIGGGSGTSIVTAGMRELPIGMPKLMVSTLASGDVGPFVGVSDIAMMYSVTDIAGLNRISRAVLHNAAQAVAGMAKGARQETAGKPAIGLTMFGVTTPAVTQAVEQLKGDYDCLVFHATGTGGRAMEKLADSRMLVGVLDVTTTEVCDFLLDGVLSAGADRLGAVARTGIPYVGSAGALDMVNFWAIETVPERFRNRTLYRHTPQVTLMRTTADENRRIGAWIGAKLNRCDGPVRFLIPEKGVSALDAPGQPFYDPEADAALFAAIDETVQPDARTAASSACPITSTIENSPPNSRGPSAPSRPEGASMPRIDARPSSRNSAT